MKNYILPLICLSFLPYTATAEELTVTHSTTGNFGDELTAALSEKGLTAQDVTSLKIIGEAEMSADDFAPLRAQLKETLKKMNKINLYIIVFVGFAVYLLFFHDYNYMMVLKYDREIRDLKAEIKQSEDSFLIIRQRVESLNTDPEALEKIVREEYHMRRPHEDVYIVKER